MLSALKIENVAVIEKAQVLFGEGLNVLTGETGAGKSILIDSINAILGNRTSRDLVRSGTKKACIWATFENIPEAARKRLADAGYEADRDLLLYREISAEGKGACRINGMPATASVMRDIGQELITIHGQHDSQSLMNPAKHLSMLDAYAQNQTAYEAYYLAYRKLINVKREMEALAMDEAEKKRRIEFLRTKIEEIDAAGLQKGEEAALQARKQVISHAQGILEALTMARDSLNGPNDEPGAADLLGQAATALQGAAEVDETLASNAEQLNEIYYVARDLAIELSDKLDSYQFDPAELNMIEERLNLLSGLKKKYGADEEEILQSAQSARQELENLEYSDQHLEDMNKQLHELYFKARELAKALTETRIKAFEAMNRDIIQALAFLNMPGIRLTLHHSTGPLTSHGQDGVEFYISTNPGEDPKPLAKVASGGELSRIVLAIKSAMADKDDIPTLIYDEIDTGVSGSAAGRIGELLKRTSAGRQILCITHTAQIAAFADRHLLIQKKVEQGRTFTEIEPLDENGRVHALAKIISGDHITDLSLANAKEMIETARMTPHKKYTG